MGYAFGYACCWACKVPFPFHPDYVPSLKINRKTNKVDSINGKREPICESCMTLTNEKRKAMGLEPHPIDPRAYGIAREEEI